MFEKLKAIGRRIDAWGDRVHENLVHKLTYVETFRDLIVVLAIFGSVWAYAWYGHIIGPWVDNLLGLGPHGIDSLGKIRWRRMYSTAFCAPPMLYAILRYTYNKWKKRQ